MDYGDVAAPAVQEPAHAIDAPRVLPSRAEKVRLAAPTRAKVCAPLLPYRPGPAAAGLLDAGGPRGRGGLPPATSLGELLARPAALRSPPLSKMEAWRRGGR